MPARADPLLDYNEKRDFGRTKEPKGERKATSGERLFVVQKHDATRLHFDFRLELDGVLKSWAVTRGPSLDPADKRLAVRTEDHPFAYRNFEGTIPEGEYGGGTVMLWDEGTWEPVPGKDPKRTLEEGHLHFILHGQRMKGEWLLVRMKLHGKEKRENWLLRKVDDGEAGSASELVDRQVTSIRTGRSMAEIAEGRAAPEKAKSSSSSLTKTRRKAAQPAFRPVQLATLVDAVPTGPGWFHEIKYDGYRALIATGNTHSRAFTRTGLDWSDRFRVITQAFDKIGLPSALIDGEVVALGEDGKPDFRTLQDGLKDGSAPLHYFAFDLLEENGEDLTDLSNKARKDRLRQLLADAKPPIVIADDMTQGEKLFHALCEQGYEGIISKRADAPYRGRRTRSWLKVKCTRRQEFIIIGWTESERGRGFRSLLLGVHNDGALVYAGKVGTGFSASGIDDLLKRLEKLSVKKAPADVPRAAARGAHWVKPKLVAEIAYTETTAPLGEGGVLRHPSFLGLREDKKAVDVVPEKAAPLDPKPRAKESRAKKTSPANPEAFGIKISNRDRVIYPEAGLTKGALADYYAAMAEPILAFAASRPISLVRCPQGRAKQCFFQKHDSGSFGEAVHHVPIREKDGTTADYLYIEDGAGLLACVQMGAIEFHGWGSRVDHVEQPDRLVIDLDPDPGVDFEAVKKAALIVKRELANLGLATDPMLSGGKGIHIVAGLNETANWATVKDFASRFARALGEANSAIFTANMKKAERKGRIFIDWLRNQRGATAVLPWTVRARENAPVAMPITWTELEVIESPSQFTILQLDDILERANSRSLSDWGTTRQPLPQA
jgi:bifunctional non-homologous end joining protein LigD